MQTTAKKDHTGRIVLWALLAFFGVLASVNAFFVYTAVTTNTGVVTENAYEKGLRYNEILKEARRRKNEQSPPAN